MSWLFSQALVEEYSEDTSLDGEQSALLNGNLTQQAYCAPDKMTAFSRLSRFGMMFKPLTANLGEELLMSYLEAFPVRTSVQQEKAQELTESDQECGITWRGWLAKFDPDTFSWKTAQCSLLEDLNESLETLPRSGMTRSGLLWELPMLEQTIRGTEFGLLEKLPTPQASDHITKKTSASWKAKGGVNFTLSNPDIQAKWASPNARDWKDSGASQGNKKSPNLGTQVHLVTENNGGKLNPTWVEWLMGWPLGWTDLKPLEMDKFHSVPQQHGES